MKRIFLEVLGDFSFFRVGHPAEARFLVLWVLHRPSGIFIGLKAQFSRKYFDL